MVSPTSARSMGPAGAMGGGSGAVSGVWVVNPRGLHVLGRQAASVPGRHWECEVVGYKVITTAIARLCNNMPPGKVLDTGQPGPCLAGGGSCCPACFSA